MNIYVWVLVVIISGHGGGQKAIERVGEFSREAQCNEAAEIFIKGSSEFGRFEWRPKPFCFKAIERSHD